MLLLRSGGGGGGEAVATRKSKENQINYGILPKAYFEYFFFAFGFYFVFF